MPSKRRRKPTSPRALRGLTHWQFFVPNEMHAKVREIATWEERSLETTYNTLLYLGMSVYERLTANLAGADLLPPGSPTPSPHVLRWFMDDVIGRRILDAEAQRWVARAAGHAEVEQRQMAEHLESARELRRKRREENASLPSEPPTWEEVIP
jgi:hypothetical protein